MTKTEREKINEYLDKANDGITEYAETLESTDVIRYWLDEIYKLVNKED